MSLVLRGEYSVGGSYFGFWFFFWRGRHLWPQYSIPIQQEKILKWVLLRSLGARMARMSITLTHIYIWTQIDLLTAYAKKIHYVIFFESSFKLSLEELRRVWRVCLLRSHLSIWTQIHLLTVYAKKIHYINFFNSCFKMSLLLIGEYSVGGSYFGFWIFFWWGMHLWPQYSIPIQQEKNQKWVLLRSLGARMARMSITLTPIHMNTNRPIEH